MLSGVLGLRRLARSAAEPEVAGSSPPSGTGQHSLSLPLFLPGASSGWSQAALDCGGLVTFASLLSLDAFLRKICVGLQGTAPPQRGCQCLPPVTRHWGLAWPEAYPAKAASPELPALFFSAALGTNLLDLLHQPPNDGGCKSRLWQL